MQATDSMSEMPLTNRIWIENNLHHYDFIFIGYDERFDGIDNLTYFEPNLFIILKSMCRPGQSGLLAVERP